MMTLFDKKTKLETGNFIAATLVDWHQSKSTKIMQKRLKKTLRKFLKTKTISNNQINTFNVCSATFNLIPDDLHRKKIENKIRGIFVKYAKEINKASSRKVKKNEDSRVYKEYFTYLNNSMLKEEFLEKEAQKTKQVYDEIELIVSQASIVIWDLPGYEKDKIILPDVTATLTNNTEIPLINIIDELLIMNFAKHYLPYSKQLIDESLTTFTSLNNIIKNYEKYNINSQAKKMIRNFIGIISGFQETLKLFKREIERVSEVTIKTLYEIKEFPSVELQNLINIDFKELNQELKHKIELINDLIDETKVVLRQILSNDENSFVDFTNQLYSIIIDIKTQCFSINYWTNKFKDLPSFTTMTDGIAYEKVENETYISSGAFLEGQKLFKKYNREENSIYALRGIDIQINKGDFVVIQGPSGSGKTTLLNILAGLDNVNRGAVFFENKNLIQLKDSKRTVIRRDYFGFIFQSYALIPHLTAYENTKIPLDLSGLSKELQDSIIDLLNDVGIGQYASQKPAFLSGGQMQRLGIARALIKRPAIIFADEPTGDLDEKTGRKVMDLIKKYHEETGVTVILVTHNSEIANYGSKKIFIKDGEIMNVETMIKYK